MLQYWLALLGSIMPATRKSEKGQDLTEYGLLVGVIALIVIVMARVFGVNLTAFFERLATEVGTW